MDWGVTGPLLCRKRFPATKGLAQERYQAYLSIATMSYSAEVGRIEKLHPFNLCDAL